MRLTTATRDAAFALAMLAACTGLAQARPPGTSEVPMDLQDGIEAQIIPKLVLPETAIWDFEFIAPYPAGGDVVCGRVDYQSASRKYEGPHRFYAVVRDKRIVTLQLEDPPSTDVSGQQAAKFKLLCDRN